MYAYLYYMHMCTHLHYKYTHVDVCVFIYIHIHYCIEWNQEEWLLYIPHFLLFNILYIVYCMIFMLFLDFQQDEFVIAEWFFHSQVYKKGGMIPLSVKVTLLIVKELQ